MSVNKILLLVTVLALSGCADERKSSAESLIKKPHRTPAQLCIEGVLYYGMGHGITPAFSRKGSVIMCNVP